MSSPRCVVVAGWCIAAAPLAACQEPVAGDAAPPAAWRFVDVAAEAGLDFRHSFGDDQFSKILEDTGSGVALLDYDQDGWLDVYLAGGQWLEGLSDPAFRERTSGLGGRLYRNLHGERKRLEFRDVTAEVGLVARGYGMGAAVADYDADGDDDLLLLDRGRNSLWRNDRQPDGRRRFTDVTDAAGIAGPATLNGQPKWSVNGCFFDADGDGDLDLYVTNYLAFDPAYADPNLPKEYPYEGPESYSGQQSILWRNRGDGTFEDATEAAGLAFPDGRSMGAVAADFDGDGDLDLFEAIDSRPDLLWWNDGRGRFTEGGAAAGVAFDGNGAPMASMHGTAGDFDGDGRLDLFVPALFTSALFRNLGGPAPAGAAGAAGAAEAAAFPHFEEHAAKAGVLAALAGKGAWGSGAEDFDLDGDLDLLVVLGGAFDLKAADPDVLFRNDGEGRFTDVSRALGPVFQVGRVSRGAAFGDLDRDGDVDYVVNVKDVGAPPRVLRNDLPRGEAGPHWIAIRLVGAGKNRDAVGARVTLRAGGRVQQRVKLRSNSYLSQDSPWLHFGLGAVDRVESIDVRWPSGRTQAVSAFFVDSEITVFEEPRRE